jgi:molybdopterin molybdotransferase
MCQSASSPDGQESAGNRPPGENPPAGDVRMRGFTRRTTVSAAIDWVDRNSQLLTAEMVPLGAAGGRVLAENVVSRVDVPGFPRAMMDGFAVIAADTAGASLYNRLPLEVVGQTLPGQSASVAVKSGKAIRIMTGAAMPPGADAVLPAEQAEVDGSRILVLEEIPPGKHFGRVGEDIAAGTRILERGRQLRPQDLGVLSSVGAGAVPVVRRPVVRIVITGNELLPAGTPPRDARIADANGPMLDCLVRRDGGSVRNPGIVPDDRDAILEALSDDADVVVVSGGSSVGQEDFAPSLVARYGNLAIHGIAMRPSSPTGMGIIGRRMVFLLPGNPVSCLCAYDMFAGRAIRILGGRNRQWPYRAEVLPLSRKLVSVVGRYDYARVRIADNQVEPIAISGASLLSSTTRADGFVIIPEDSEGYAPGTMVQVHLYD